MKIHIEFTKRSSIVLYVIILVIVAVGDVCGDVAACRIYRSEKPRQNSMPLI